MTLLYKGVGVGTFHYPTDLRTAGIQAASPTANVHVSAMVRHVANGVTRSPFISVTRSYAVAADYALRAGLGVPSPNRPGFVYEIDIPDPPPARVVVYDPVQFVSGQNSDPLTPHSYHHDGGPNLLLGIVDPTGQQSTLSAIPASPPGLARKHAARVTDALVAIVNALRDAEVLILGAVPKAWVADRYDVS